MKHLYIKINQDYNINFKDELGVEGLYKRHEMLEARMEELEEKTTRQDAVAKSEEIQTRNGIDKELREID